METGAYAGDNAGDGMGRWEHVEATVVWRALLLLVDGCRACVGFGSTYQRTTRSIVLNLRSILIDSKRLVDAINVRG
jgi:hypothetical protein